MNLGKSVRKIAWLILLPIVSLFGLVLIYAGVVEPNWIEVKQQPVYISELPSAFEGFRIIQLSDLHGKLFFNGQIAGRVNRLNPDVVAITGDVFDYTEETPIDYVDKVFKGIHAEFGTFFVFGNNDSYLDKQQVEKKLGEMNIKTLVNERVRITLESSSIDLVGVDDAYSQKADLPKALKGTGTEPKILLTHTPEIINLVAKENIDLALAGHTHGGQILIPFLPRLITNVSKGYEQYISGLYQVGNTQIYINRGLGENDIHMRFLCRPEISVITLHRK